MKIDPVHTQLHEHYKQLQTVVDSLQQYFNMRMQIHEDEIIKVAHQELKKIQQQSQQVIERYSRLIEEKNISNELSDLRLEVVFYQQQAIQYHELSQELQKQVNSLKKEVESLKMVEDASHKALRNVSKKYLRERLIRQRAEWTHSPQQSPPREASLEPSQSKDTTKSQTATKAQASSVHTPSSPSYHLKRPEALLRKEKMCMKLRVHRFHTQGDELPPIH